MDQDPLYRPLPDSFDPPRESPPPPQPAREFSWTLALSTFLWLAGATAALWFLVPKFAEVFVQVKVTLPRATETLMAVSRAACRWPWIFALPAVLLPAWVGRWKGRAATLAKVLLPLVTLATVAALVFALFSPVIGLKEGIGKRPRVETRLGR